MGASSNSIINDYIAGALGGAAGLIVGHPFDTTKVQLQTQTADRAYKGTWDAMKHINRAGWTKGFFRGLGFPLVSYGLVNSIFFGVYGNSLAYLSRGSPKNPSNMDIFTAGCVGGAVQLVVACPVDVVKVVLQSQISTSSTGANSHYYTGPLQCLRELLRHGGIRSCYCGLPVMAARDLPASAGYFLIYVRMAEYLQKTCISDRYGVVAELIAGGSAGVLTWIMVMPLDVIKSRLQSNFRTQITIKETVKLIYAQSGLRGFYRGVVAASMRAFPCNAVIFLVYSRSAYYLNLYT